MALFTSLEAAIRHHLDAVTSAGQYSPASQHLPADLSGPIGPVDPILAGLDPLLTKLIILTEQEVRDLTAFVGDGLLDPRAKPDNLRKLVPDSVPSGRSVLKFEFPAK
jgi:cytochrome c peroxidase